MLNANEAVLLLLNQAKEKGNVKLNRTIFQKLLYFLKVLSRNETLSNVNFKPYYYGPYSPDILEAIDTLQSLHFIKEKKEEHENYTEYLYELEKKSEKIASTIKNENKEAAEIIDKLFQKLPINSTELISIMAKTYYIIKSNSDGKVTTAQIEAEAKKLGWNVSKSKISKAAEKLVQLGLVEKH